MKVAFDYLQGPVLGHKVRCEVLQKQLVAMGHEIVAASEKFDWLIVDYPDNSKIVNLNLGKRMLMGSLPSTSNDYAWHPLGDVVERTLHGAQYIIIDPSISIYVSSAPKDGILITCGGADPFLITEKLIDILGGEIAADVVIGPNFKRAVAVPKSWLRYDSLSHDGMVQIMSSYKTIIAAWGGTVFEGLALGARVIPITTQPEHPAEAKMLKIPYINREYLWDYTIAHELAGAPYCNYGIDFMGAQRVVEFMEQIA